MYYLFGINHFLKYKSYPPSTLECKSRNTNASKYPSKKRENRVIRSTKVSQTNSGAQQVRYILL